MADTEWVRGDLLGLDMPADSQTLRRGGEDFLTSVFRTTGVLPAVNRVVAITHFEEWSGGSTGSKLLLSVRYDDSAPQLPTELFVKFSRDFTNPHRDRARLQMESEVRFALLSRKSGFPIAVPLCLFADYQHESGTGVLISERIGFGRNGIERHYDKCLDAEMPEPLEHYKAVTRALARLAGAHRAGRLGTDLGAQFPFDAQTFSVSDRTPYTPKQLVNRVSRFGEFAARHPNLLPKDITNPEFVARLAQEIVRFPDQTAAIRGFLQSRPDLVALCHWNANMDNAWFWQGTGGELECGLLDWGHVSQMNVAMALWGSYSAADLQLWDQHLDELLVLFIGELQRSGGPALNIAELKLHLHLYIAMMGVAWLMDAPALVQSQLADVPEADFERQLKAKEATRVQLHMMVTFLHLWSTQDFGTLLERMRASQG